METDAELALLLSDLPTFAERFRAMRPAWMADAACSEHSRDLFFPQLGNVVAPARAKAICRGCLVRDECAAYAIPDPGIKGIWGGLSDKERSQARNGRGAPTGRLREIA